VKISRQVVWNSITRHSSAWLEHSSDTRAVLGSNPSGGTSMARSSSGPRRQPFKLDITGSNPVRATAPKPGMGTGHADLMEWQTCGIQNPVPKGVRVQVPQSVLAVNVAGWSPGGLTSLISLFRSVQFWHPLLEDEVIGQRIRFRCLGWVTQDGLCA
jgi:hypothetical protein